MFINILLYCAQNHDANIGFHTNQNKAGYKKVVISADIYGVMERVEYLS
jgi:hypothetical protein